MHRRWFIVGSRVTTLRRPEKFSRLIRKFGLMILKTISSKSFDFSRQWYTYSWNRFPVTHTLLFLSRNLFLTSTAIDWCANIVKRERRTTKQTSSVFSLTTNGLRCLLSVLLFVTSLAKVGKQQHRTIFDHPQGIIFFFSRNGNCSWTLLMQWVVLLMRRMKTFACWCRIVASQRKRKERTL